uniref:R3H-associated N-terminal domain-containing protein n=1 Tax=Rhipicephalus appendiculatus TaxID=34631 RepID=A0A131YUI7_RHIAP
MGVIRNGANGKGPFSAASCDVLDGFNSHDEGDEPVPLVVHVDHSSSLLERRRRTARRSMPACADVSGLGTRGKRLSSRKVRRLDNKHFLHDLAEEDEDAVGQLTIDDFVHQSVSAFSRLLADLDNHEVWDEVLNCTGQPQPLPEDDESDEIAIEVASSLPASGGCFQRLDAALRTLLRRQRVPLGTLCLLESELCLSFEREPCGEKHYRLASSFERLLLHALCQYMSLFAHSYDVEGKRWTRVRNSTAEFCRPSESLSAYLERYWAARGAC